MADVMQGGKIPSSVLCSVVTMLPARCLSLRMRVQDWLARWCPESLGMHLPLPDSAKTSQLRRVLPSRAPFILGRTRIVRRRAHSPATAKSVLGDVSPVSNLPCWMWQIQRPTPLRLGRPSVLLISVCHPVGAEVVVLLWSPRVFLALARLTNGVRRRLAVRQCNRSEMCEENWPLDTRDDAEWTGRAGNDRRRHHDLDHPRCVHSIASRDPV